MFFLFWMIFFLVFDGSFIVGFWCFVFAVLDGWFVAFDGV